MKITLEMVDGFLISMPNGKTEHARVARVEIQDAPRKPRRVANIIVETEDAPTLLEAAAAYLRSEQ